MDGERRSHFALQISPASRNREEPTPSYLLLSALLLYALLLAFPATAISGEYDTPFWRCFDNYCKPHKDACYATLCSTSKSGCAVPCGIFDNRGGPCPRVCSSIGSLYENHECNIQYRDFATACMSGCVQPDSPKAFDCAWECKSKADSLRKQCWVLVNEQRVTPEDAVKQVYPTRSRGESAASGDRYIIHNGKVFVINEAKWKRRVLRDLPPELGTFYTDEFDPLHMDWASEGIVIITGVATGAAVAVGVMTLGSAVVIGATVTFAASSLTTYVSESADTLDNKAAVKKAVNEGLWNASIGVGIDLATAKGGEAFKGVLKSAIRNSAKVVTRSIGKETIEKAVAPVARTQVGKLTNQIFQKTFNTRRVLFDPKSQRYFATTRGDAILDGLETGLGNRYSGWLNNVSKKAHEDGLVGDSIAAIKVKFTGSNE